MTRPNARVRRLRIGIFGFFGIGNLGNEGSLSAFLEHVRRLDVDVQCFAADPEVVRHEHGIPSTALMSHRASAVSRGRVAQVRKAWGRLVDLPRLWHLVGLVDVVVVPGMGVLEPVLGGDNLWGFAYWQLLACAFARLRRRPFVLLSIGMGAPTDRWTRLYYRTTVRLSRYTTFRDHGSRTASEDLDGRAWPGTVTADLAFGLTGPPGDTKPVPGRVVIGVMGPDEQRVDAEGVARYTENMSRVVDALLDGGQSIRIVVGDLADEGLAHEICDKVRERRSDANEELLRVSSATTLPNLMTEMVEAEVVVASRYHNLICAMMVRRPAVSLGYAEKNAELLSYFGLAGYDRPMTDFDVDVLVRQVGELRTRRQDLEPGMARTLEWMRASLREQYRDLDERVLER